MKREDNSLYSGDRTADEVFDNLPYTSCGGVVAYEAMSVPKQKRRPFGKVLMAVAAILAIPLSIYFVYHEFFSLSTVESQENAQRLQSVIKAERAYAKPMLTYTTAKGTMGRVVLPDSSVVWLNSGSTISFPSRFDSLNRKVDFSGEGYFCVSKHPEWPMCVSTSSGITAVITGTEFNISCYDDDPNYNLALIDGSLSVYRSSTHSVITMNPLEEVVIAKGKTGPESAHKRYADVTYLTAWKRGTLKFKNESMQEVVRRLNRWYGYDISIYNRKIASYRFTGEFRSESLVQVLEIIKISSNVRYSITNHNVVLY